MLKPQWSPEIQFGHLLQVIVISVQAIAVVGGGLWFAFSVVGDMDKRITRAEVTSRENVLEFQGKISKELWEQANRVSLIEQAVKNQSNVTNEFRGELRTQLKEMGDKVDKISNVVNNIQLGLANKVDRKP